MNTIHQTGRCPRSCIKIKNTPAVGQTGTFRALAFLIMTMVFFAAGAPVGAAAEKKEPIIIGHDKVGGARVAGGRYLAATFDRPRNYDTEAWPVYHISVLPDEGRARPYDTNGCIYWKGRYHLMYIFQDPARRGGHCWGHVSSTDLVNWTYHPTALGPEPGDPDKGIYSGNAFVNKDGVPMLCYNGIGAGVCVATAKDDELIKWKKHPQNPIIPRPKKGEPGHGAYRVGDPYLWLEGDTYYCLLGGNELETKKDTLYLCRSSDLVNWKPLHPFYVAKPSWTVPGEDMACPDFFKLGNKHVLLGISHRVGARCYIGQFDKEKEKFFPEKHMRMNWPGANFFAPESLIDDKGRRIFWAWVTDPRLRTTQLATGSGVQSLPRVMSLDKDGTLLIKPVKELETLRRNHRRIENIELSAGSEKVLEDIRGNCLELAVQIEPASACQVGLKVRCSPDGEEETVFFYDRVAKKLKMDMSRSTMRDDVAYPEVPQSPGSKNFRAVKGVIELVVAPFELKKGEPLRFRVFLDKPMLEVFANDRHCVTQQVFPKRNDSLLIKVFAKGGPATVRRVDAWDMAAAKFVDKRAP